MAGGIPLENIGVSVNYDCPKSSECLKLAGNSLPYCSHPYTRCGIIIKELIESGRPGLNPDLYRMCSCKR